MCHLATLYDENTRSNSPPGRAHRFVPRVTVRSAVVGFLLASCPQLGASFLLGDHPCFGKKVSLSLSLSLGELARPVRTSSGNHTTLCGSHRAGGLLWCKGNPGSDYTNKYLLDKT
jgi:hypothetical protein